MSEQKVEVKVGTKLEQSEVNALDPAKIGPTQILAPKEGEVEGQYLRWRSVFCPYCNGYQNLVEDTDRYTRYRCSYCGGIFKF